MSEEKTEEGRKRRDAIMVIGLFGSAFFFPALCYCIGSTIAPNIAYYITMMVWGIFCLIWIGYWGGGRGGFIPKQEGDRKMNKEEMGKWE